LDRNLRRDSVSEEYSEASSNTAAMSSTELSTAVAPTGRDVLSEVPTKSLTSGRQVAMDAVEDIVFGSVRAHMCDMKDFANAS
jgi:hypothetical protein